MRKSIAITILLLAMGYSAVAQEKKKEENAPKRIKLHKVDTSKPSEAKTLGNPKASLTDEEKIKQHKTVLEAIDKKEEAIRKDPEQLKIAKESGWFEKADKTRTELNKEIKALQTKQTK